MDATFVDVTFVDVTFVDAYGRRATLRASAVERLASRHPQSLFGAIAELGLSTVPLAGARVRCADRRRPGRVLEWPLRPEDVCSAALACANGGDTQLDLKEVWDFLGLPLKALEWPGGTCRVPYELLPAWLDYRVRMWDMLEADPGAEKRPPAPPALAKARARASPPWVRVDDGEHGGVEARTAGRRAPRKKWSKVCDGTEAEKPPPPRLAAKAKSRAKATRVRIADGGCEEHGGG